MISSIRPALSLIRRAWLRFKRGTLNPMAPADMHMELMLQLADMERESC